MQYNIFKSTLVLSCVFVCIKAAWAQVPSIPTQERFFESLKMHCGKAFLGKIVKDNEPSEAFSNSKLVMHVMRCTDTQLHIPFHVGDDASRTWIITKTGSGLSLKHDHRHKDGTEDSLTQYGGHTASPGWPQVQSFPADAFTKALFVEQGIPQSIDNTWQFFVYPERISYRLIRPAREFRVDFDLTQPIPPPSPPWGYEE